MANLAKASVVIEFAFSGRDGNSLVLEVNADDNNGKTTFLPGDSVYFRLYKIGDFQYNLGSTSGNISFIGDNYYSDELVDLTFTLDEPSQSSNKPISSITSVYWYGTSLGTINVVDSSIFQPVNTGYAVATVGYKSPYTKYLLSNACSFIPAETGKYLVLVHAEEII